MESPKPISGLLLPAMLLAGLIDLLGYSVYLHVPLKQVAPYLFLGALLVSAGLLLWRRPRFNRIGVAVVIGLSLMVAAAYRANWPDCSPRSAVIIHPDAWHYVAAAKYYWENDPRVSTGLSTSDEYATHLRGGRLGTYTMLGLLSYLGRPGDPASVMSLYVVLCAGLFFLAMFYVARALELPPATSAAAAFLAVGAGWVWDAVVIGNLDNLLFLAFFTPVVGIAINLAKPESRLRDYTAALALLFSGAMFAYPEGAAVTMLIALPVAVMAVRQIIRRRELDWFLPTIAITLMLGAPRIALLPRYLIGTSTAATSSALRFGSGNFPGLLRATTMVPAAFALGEEYPGADVSLVNYVLPILLIGLGVLGARLLTRNVPFLLCGACIAVLFVWQTALKYDYGMYKVLQMSSFWVFPLIAAGLAAFVVNRGVILAGAVVVLIGAAWVDRHEDYASRPWQGSGCTARIADLASVHFVTRNGTLALDVHDPFAQMWAVYYLRDSNLVVTNPQLYLAYPHVRPLLALARGSSGPITARLEDTPSPDAIWSDGKFSLVTADHAAIVSVENPNGLETYQGESFTWIGTESVLFKIAAGASGAYMLKADEFLPGPSLPGDGTRHLQIVIHGATNDFAFRAGASGIPLNLSKGENIVRLRCTDQPTRLKQANGDTRPLLLGLKGYYLYGPEHGRS